MSSAAKPWYLYVLECKNNYLYTGITTDVQARFDTHKIGKGARFTRINPPKRILMVREYPDRSTASKAEYAFKQLTLVRKNDEIKRLSVKNSQSLAQKPRMK